MPLSPALVIAISLAYVMFLFAVAYWAEHRMDRGRSLINNPFVYALSIGIYCTSWTFYGSVGLAASKGMGYLAIYIGPTLAAITWWVILRRIIRVSQENHLPSVADFVAFRYGKSGGLGALAALIFLVGIPPYIGLQLKSIVTTFSILTGTGTETVPSFPDTGLFVALILGIFAGLFGARRLDPSERHEGMVAAVAVESIVKLLAFLAVGIFVTWWIFDGPTDIFARVGDLQEYPHLTTFGQGDEDTYINWFSLLVLSGTAVMLLPRQFHVMVVENCSERHVATSMWMFPLYLFLINIFVLPVAVGGIVLFGGTELADTFVLLEPLKYGQPALALVAFLGGLSAAAGMVIVSSVALSIMLLNNLILPLLLRYRWKEDLSGVLLHLKRGGIIVILLLGYLYSETIGPSLSLVNMGLLSFAAAAQLAPVVFGGLLWRRATAKGAAAGLIMGLLTWVYLFLTPALAWSGVLPEEWLSSGPFGITLLRPNAFLGLTGLDIWSHGLVWSALLNCGAFIVVSLMTEPSRAEIEQVARMVHAARGMPAEPREYRLARAPTVAEFEGILAKFLGPKKARQRIRAFFSGARVARDEKLPDRTVVRLRQYVESQLGGVVGATAANEVVERYLAVKGTRMEEIFDVFGEVSLSLEESRIEVERRVRELSVLYEASKRIAETLDERDAVGAVLDLLESDFGLRCQGVLFYDGKVLTPGLTRGEGRRLAEEASGGPPQATNAIGRAILEERTVTSSLEESGWLFGAPGGQRSLLASPIRKENRTLGVIFAASSTSSGYFSETFVETFEALASELALALSNARLFAEVRDLNRTLEEKVRDRTAELQAAYAHLQDMDRMKSQFLANMSHELRTPMNSILGFTQLVLDGVDGPLTADQTASLQRVEKNAGHLLALINDLLDLSRIESGKMRLDLHSINVGALAQDVAADLCSTAEAKGLYCVCETPPEPVHVLADPLRIRQVLNNLLNNAIKFTDQGGITMRVTRRTDEVEGAAIQVIDTGMGIPAEKQEIIFDAFRQLDGTITRSHGGAGLGLSITKRIVELHGGVVRVTSHPGEGATFNVLLPSEPPANMEKDSDGITHPGG